MQKIQRGKHVLALVRRACGITQTKLAKLLGVAPITIQRIEQTTLALSEELAHKAQEKLDVSAEWLLRNDPTIPILSARNAYWTKELYEFRRGNRLKAYEKALPGKGGIAQFLEHPPEELASKLTDWHVADFQLIVAGLLKGSEGSPRQAILVHRLEETLRELHDQFDFEEEVMKEGSPAVLEKLRIFKEAALKYGEEETKRLWQKPSKKHSSHGASDRRKANQSRPSSDVNVSR